MPSRPSPPYVRRRIWCVLLPRCPTSRRIPGRCGIAITDEYRGIQQNLANLEILKTQTIPTLAQALIDQLKVQEADLDKRIDVAGKGLEQVPARATTETRLVRDFAAAENLFKTLQERYEEAKLSEVSAIPDLKILDRATIPQKPSSNSAPKIIFMAFAASLGLAVGLALLLDQLDKRFRYPEQVSRELGLSILGAIPAIRKSKQGRIDAGGGFAR